MLATDGISDRQVAVNQAASLIDFTVAEGKEFRLAFSNLKSITRYNNGFYAMSAHQIEEAMRDMRK